MNYVLLNESPRVVGRVFSGQYFEALSRAQSYAGSNGFIATLPWLLQANSILASKKEQMISPFGISTGSEELVGVTISGKEIYAVIHGDKGILNSRTSRSHQRLISSFPSLDYLMGSSFQEGEVDESDFFEIITDERKLPVYTLEDALENRIPFPPRCLIVTDFKNIEGDFSLDRYHQKDVDSLYENPLFVMRASSKAMAKKYLDSCKGLNISRLFHTHQFKDLERPQGRVLSLNFVFPERLSGGIVGNSVFYAPDFRGSFIAVNRDTSDLVPSEKCSFLK